MNLRESVDMIQSWSSWKRFPEKNNGDAVEAPIGPGVYEVRHTMSGRAVAFGWTANVARALSELNIEGRMSSKLARLFGMSVLVPRRADLEYRTCAAGSRSEARAAASRLLGLKQTAWCKRVSVSPQRLG
jgi:hypothetical protein